MILEMKSVVLNKEEIDQLIVYWKDVQKIINYFCQQTINGFSILEEIRYLTKQEQSLYVLNNILNDILENIEFSSKYIEYQNQFMILLSIYKNFSNYLNLLNEQNILNQKLEILDNGGELVPNYLIKLNNLKLAIDQIANINKWKFILVKQTEKQNFKIGYYQLNLDNDITNIALQDDGNKNDFLKSLMNVEISLKNLDVDNTIAHLMYLFRVIENDFNLQFDIIDKDYSTLVRKFIHSVIRHGGLLNESHGLKLRHGFNRLSTEKQLELLEDAKNYLVTIKLLATRKSPDFIFKKFKNILNDNDITLPGFIPIEINKIIENCETTNFIEVHRDGNHTINNLNNIPYKQLERYHFSNQIDCQEVIVNTKDYELLLNESENNELTIETNDENLLINQDENFQEIIEDIDYEINNDNQELTNYVDQTNIDDLQVNLDDELIKNELIIANNNDSISMSKKEKKTKKTSPTVTICSPLWQKNESTKQLLIDIGVQKKKDYDFDERINYIVMNNNINKLNNVIDKNSFENNSILFEQNYINQYLENISFEKYKKEKLNKLTIKQLQREAKEKMQKLNEKRTNK